VKQQNGWIELLRDGKAMLRDLLDATERRYKELDRTKPLAFLLNVDQSEELYVRAEERQRGRFSEVIAQGIADPRLYMPMSMRTDFLGNSHCDVRHWRLHCEEKRRRDDHLCLVAGISKSEIGELKRHGITTMTDFPGQGRMKAEQLEIARSSDEVAKLKAERDILKKKPRPASRRNRREVRFHCEAPGDLVGELDVRGARQQRGSLVGRS
jgi:hypothetical protein